MVGSFIYTNNEYKNQYWFVIFLIQRVGNQWYKGWERVHWTSGIRDKVAFSSSSLQMFYPKLIKQVIYTITFL